MTLSSSELLQIIQDKKYDLHTHTRYSDGKNTPEEMIQRAIENKLDVIGISDHAPLPFDDEAWFLPWEKLDQYVEDVSNLKKKYQDKIKILLGLEVDYFPNKLDHYRTLDLSRFDYTIGSVHFYNLRRQNGTLFDVYADKSEYPEIIKTAGSVPNLVDHYYRIVLEAAQSKMFTFLGHYDLIKINNLYFDFFNDDENWYQEIALKHLPEIIKENIAFEINTSLKRKGGKDFHPSEFIITKLQQLNVSLITNSDAHKVDDLKII